MIGLAGAHPTPHSVHHITMNRIQGVQDNEAGLTTRFIFWLTKKYLKRVPLGTRVRALDPKLLKNCVRMDFHTAKAVAVSGKLKELAQLKVAAMVGCPF
jgi:hypothetical protein